MYLYKPKTVLYLTRVNVRIWDPIEIAPPKINKIQNKKTKTKTHIYILIYNEGTCDLHATAKNKNKNDRETNDETENHQ